jgi:hypothetical protein
MLPLTDQWLADAAPTVLRQLDELQRMRWPAQDEPPARDLDPGPCSAAMFQLLKALRMVTEAALSDDASEQDLLLRGANAAAQYAAGHTRDGRAQLLDVDALAAAEDSRRVSDSADIAIIDSAVLSMGLPTGRVVQVAVQVDDATGRASWSSDEIALAPIGPRRQQDITDLLRELGTVIVGAVPEAERDPS